MAGRDHGSIPRKRVIVSRHRLQRRRDRRRRPTELDGTLLSLHFYGFWANHTTEAEWKANLLPRIGEYG